MEYGSEEERWIWLSSAAKHRLIPAAYAGPMTQKAANIIVEQTCERINEEKLPLFVTDGRKYYKQALLNRYGFIKEFPGTGKRDRPRKPEQMPLHELKYVQVVKKRRWNTD